MSSREERRRRSSPGVVTIAPMSDPHELPGIGKALSAVPAQNCEKKISVGIVGGNRLLREYLSTSIKSQADVTCSLSEACCSECGLGGTKRRGVCPAGFRWIHFEGCRTRRRYDYDSNRT